MVRMEVGKKKTRWMNQGLDGEMLMSVDSVYKGGLFFLYNLKGADKMIFFIGYAYLKMNKDHAIIFLPY